MVREARKLSKDDTRPMASQWISQKICQFQISKPMMSITKDNFHSTLSIFMFCPLQNLTFIPMTKRQESKELMMLYQFCITFLALTPQKIQEVYQFFEIHVLDRTRTMFRYLHSLVATRKRSDSVKNHIFCSRSFLS